MSDIEIPSLELGFTDDYYELKDVKKNVYDKFYFPKNDKSEGNEISFIIFLENNDNVVWWHKQGDHGKDYFSIIYKEKRWNWQNKICKCFILSWLNY